MSTAGISFGGLASGLDTKAIISALTAIERRPIQQLEAKKTALNKQKSLFGDLGGLLDKLAKAAKDLQTTAKFLQRKATSSDQEVLTATANTSAAAGSHDLVVNSLARAQINFSAGSASPTASLGGPASLQIDVGGNTHLIAVNSPTLQSVADAINGQQIGVRAEVVDTGNPSNGGAQRYQLVLRATQTGTAGAFTVAVDDGDLAFQNLIAGLAADVRSATNASLELNGVTIQRPTNSIADAIPGVTLELRKTGPVQVTVATDAEQTSKKVQEFVDAYNAVVDFFAAQNKLDADGKASSPLFGDSMLRSVRSNLRGVIGGVVPGTGNDAFQMLSQVGIRSDTQGKLTFDSAKFAEVLAEGETAVAAIFTHPTSGLMGRVVSQLQLYTDSVEGLFKARRDSFDRQVKSTQDRIDQSERRLDLYQKQLERKYANLESLLGRLQGQGSSLGSLASLTTRSRT
ncbi:MAG: flagellar filament capping protein FliD [Planctomycetes bacterium]|nr:flagellar filament capping protein FliD [Planctomycetota bacterium]